jgi:uncharacterized membrane protein YtjA (UPF0391 family)
VGTRIARLRSPADRSRQVRHTVCEPPFYVNPAFLSVGGLMLRYAAIFFVIAIIAAVFGFGGIAAGATEIAKVLFFIFVVIFLVTLLMGVMRR